MYAEKEKNGLNALKILRKYLVCAFILFEVISFFSCFSLSGAVAHIPTQTNCNSFETRKTNIDVL